MVSDDNYTPVLLIYYISFVQMLSAVGQTSKAMQCLTNLTWLNLTYRFLLFIDSLVSVHHQKSEYHQ